MSEDRFKAIKVMADELESVREQIKALGEERARVHAKYFEDMQKLSRREEVLIQKEAIAQEAITKFALGEAHTYSKP